MKTAISLILFWVSLYVVAYVAIYLINVYVDAAWYEFLPQDRRQRIGTLCLAFIVTIATGGSYLRLKANE